MFLGKEKRARGPVGLGLRVGGFRDLERVLAEHGVGVPGDVVQRGDHDDWHGGSVF